MNELAVQATAIPADGRFLLDQLGIGQDDKRGRKVLDVLWANQDFKIYMTREGIGVHFSDDRRLCKTQTQQFLELGFELAHLHDLIHLLGRARPRFWRKNEPPDPNASRVYEREIARGIAQALTGAPDQGKATLKALALRIEKRLRNKARVRYLMICLVSAGAIVLMAAALAATSTQSYAGELALAAIGGSLGALLSTAAGLRNLRPDPGAGLFMSWVYGGQRMLVGVLGAIVLYLALRSGLLPELLPGVNAPTEDAVDVHKLVFLSVLAGFSERLVPDLLDRNAAGNGAGEDGGEAAGTRSPASGALG